MARKLSTKKEVKRLAKLAEEELARVAEQAKADELARLATLEEPTLRQKFFTFWRGLLSD